jgi:predicted deacylase
MPYHTNEELIALTDGHVERAGARAALAEIGATVEGRPIRAVTLAGPGRAPDPARPQALVAANIHGNEVIASEVALAIQELAVEAAPGGPAAALLEAADLTVVAAVNLDARAGAAAALAAGSLRGVSRRQNAHGVDLNRNFPVPSNARDVWYPLAGTSIRRLPWYRGPAPLSEPEARALVGLADRLRPAAAINLHSVGRFFLYPYCCSRDVPAHVADFRAMGEAFTAAQPRARYRVRQCRSWYAVLGDLDDWLYDAHGTLSVTVELSRPLAGVGASPLRLVRPLSWSNPRSPEPTIENTAAACLAALAVGVRRPHPGPLSGSAQKG